PETYTLSLHDALPIYMSEREYQTERGGQWIKGKSAPTFGPLGPWLVTPDEVGDVQDLAMELDLNGEKAQRGSTKTMIFGVAHIIDRKSTRLNSSHVKI